ncbi:MAG: response regulator [Plectolyngbya sp. WJT66-NPBG17]|jgi:diguanylate cyclase (GGDEF)-like protein|nr:response regulator [Plectolyngbya sp. WJT66-NPBG17]
MILGLPMRVLIVEDDSAIADVVARSLKEQHYAVDIAEDGAIGWESAECTAYDLILLDVDLPKLDGISLCQRLRDRRCATPILLMTAKNATEHRIRGLDAGADDYLVKPIDLGELQARVRALLRRGVVGASLLGASLLEVGCLRLDPRSCEVTYAGELLSLTPKEYSLLELFLRHPTRVFSCGDIIEHLWTFDDPPQEDSVKSHIKGLRQRLKAVGAVNWIENVYGLGYRLNQTIEKKPTIEDSQDIASPASENEIPRCESYNQAVEQLWDQYRGLMEERLSVLQQAVGALNTETLTEELQQAAERAAHKLAGVLGMFDRSEGTQISRQLEQFFSGKLNSQQQPELQLLVQQLSQVLQREQSNIEPIQVASSPTPTSIRSWNILAVDDDPIILATLKQLLEPWGMRVTGIENPLQFWTILPSVNPDLMILDVEMPQLNGVALCQAVRANPTWQSLPIVFLTAHQDTATVQQIFAAGADDYVVKPVIGHELISRITQRLERIRLLQTLTAKDSITGLSNQYHSSQAIAVLITQTQSGCFAISDLPTLRQINIQQGHTVGNQILKQFSQHLEATFQDTAILGYWGNGEFTVCVPHNSEGTALSHTSKETLQAQLLAIPMSHRFAIVQYPTDGFTVQSLYQTASLCLEGQTHE